MSRSVVRTLSLSRPIFDAGKEILELEFLEPTSQLFAELDRVEAVNRNAKRPRDVISPNFAVLSHLTGIGVESLQTLAFKDGREAFRIAGEIASEGLAEGEA